MSIFGARPPVIAALPLTGANGVVVSDVSGAATVKGNVADGASAVAVISDNAVALANSAAKIHSFRSNGVEKASIRSDGLIFSPNITNPANAACSVRGQSTDGASAVGVVLANTLALTNATSKLVSIQNNGTEKVAFDLNGKQVPASVPTTKAAGSAFCGQAALDTNGTVTIATTAVTANSLIFLNRTLSGGTAGGTYVALQADIVAGTSFIIRAYTSAAGAVTAATLDTSTIQWFIVN